MGENKGEKRVKSSNVRAPLAKKSVRKPLPRSRDIASLVRGSGERVQTAEGWRRAKMKELGFSSDSSKKKK